MIKPDHPYNKAEKKANFKCVVRKSIVYVAKSEEEVEDNTYNIKRI